MGEIGAYSGCHAPSFKVDTPGKDPTHVLRVMCFAAANRETFCRENLLVGQDVVWVSYSGSEPGRLGVWELT